MQERSFFLYRKLYEVVRQKKNKSNEIDHVKLLRAWHNGITETSFPPPDFRNAL